MYAKTGVPIIAVIAPTGSSSGDSAVLATRSAKSMSIAPRAMEAGIMSLWSDPRAILHACGTTSPTNPMIPTKATHTAVRTEATIIIHLLNLRTLSPSCFACSSPMEKRLNSLAQTIAASAIPIAGMKTSHAFSQVIWENDPYSHHMESVRLPLSSVRNTVCTEENANPTITPARM